MKKTICLICFMSLLTVLKGQRTIDALFDKYSGKEGFVCLSFSGDLLKLVNIEDNEITGCRVPADIREIRLLVQDKMGSGQVNFYNSMIKDINVRDYEELMRVRESDQDIRMLIKTEGNMIRELLLLAGGEDNFLIQLKGNITMKEARRLSSDIKIKMD